MSSVKYYMKCNRFCISAAWLFIIFSLFAGSSTAQTFIQNLEVETYYIADENDAASTSGDGIISGMVTYRLHLDLCEGCKLRRIFGSTANPIRIESTDFFFNSSVGQPFGHAINTAFLNVFDSAPLDSYLSFGGASGTNWGVLKSEDPSGSIWASRNPPQALTNNNADFGIALTVQDGLQATGGATTVPANFQSANITDFSGLFGNATTGSSFVSENFSAVAPVGVSGIGSENKLLIAQLTTLGDLSFSLNVEIIDAEGTIRTVVSANPLQGENQNNFLSYPPACGCTDPNFIEYDATAQCDDGSCSNLVVFGCLNELACNYNPGANFGIPELCCFVDSCQGLDITILCPTLDLMIHASPERLKVYPNPTRDFIMVSGDFNARQIRFAQFIDFSGRLIQTIPIAASNSSGELRIDLQSLTNGSYILLLIDDQRRYSSLVYKI